MRLIKKAQLLILLFVSIHTCAFEQYAIYTYYSKPPFVIDTASQSGLFYDFLSHLEKSNPSDNYSLVYIPRKRLESRLLAGELDGPIIGVNPLWFNDKEEKKYLWSAPFYWDADDFVSLKSSPFEYRQPEDLLNKTFAGVFGHFYVKIGRLAAAGQVNRVDTIGDIQVIAMVARGRTDFGIVSRSSMDYLLKNNEIDDIYHRSAIPHEVYDRRFLIPKNLTKWHDILNRAIQSLPQNAEWQNRLKSYK